MRTSAGFFVTGLCGKTRIQSLPRRFRCREIVTRAASICWPVMGPRVRDCSPNSPKASVAPRLALPAREPFWDLRYLVRSGARAIIDDIAMVRAAAARAVAANAHAHRIRIIDQVAARGDEAGQFTVILACQFEIEVGVMYDIPFNDDPGAAIHVNAVGRVRLPVGGIIVGRNVVNDVAAHLAVARLVVGRVRRRVLEPDRVEANVVVVVNKVVGDAPTVYVAIESN